MSELKLYHENKAGWVAHLAWKYWTGERFKPVWDALKDALTEEEKQAARLARADDDS